MHVLPDAFVLAILRAPRRKGTTLLPQVSSHQHVAKPSKKDMRTVGNSFE